MAHRFIVRSQSF